MNSAIPRKPTRLRVYWCVWMVLVAAAFVLRFTCFAGASEQRLFGLATAYGLGTWLPLMALNYIEGHRLNSHLKSHHRQQWDKINYIPLFGCVGHNGFRMVRWLYSKEDFGDPKVTELKTDYRYFMVFLLTVFFSFIIIMPVLLGL